MKSSNKTIVIMTVAVLSVLKLLLSLTDASSVLEPSHTSHVSLPPCRHVTLIAAPRHGSTWFLDTAEGCPSNQTARKSYENLISASELWTSHIGPVYNITPAEATEYVTNICSAKLFSSLKKRGEERVTEFLAGIKQNQIPVFVLRRGLGDAYGSVIEARENGH